MDKTSLPAHLIKSHDHNAPLPPRLEGKPRDEGNESSVEGAGDQKSVHPSDRTHPPRDGSHAPRDGETRSHTGDHTAQRDAGQSRMPRSDSARPHTDNPPTTPLASQTTDSSNDHMDSESCHFQTPHTPVNTITQQRTNVTPGATTHSGYPRSTPIASISPILTPNSGHKKRPRTESGDGLNVSDVCITKPSSVLFHGMFELTFFLYSSIYFFYRLPHSGIGTFMIRIYCIHQFYSINMLGKLFWLCTKI